MSNFSPKFPFGKLIWVWELDACYPKDAQGNPIRDLSLIIKKLQSKDINTVLIKCGDGSNTWQQWNQELVDTFHKAGMKILSWSFVYGQDPAREASIANWALDMGADGHVFDAEDQYEKLEDPKGSVTTMLQIVRQKHPEAFLAHSPEPIIDYHGSFPYKEFGKYCDAVLPQIYFAEWKKSPTDGINWVYDNFSRWEKSMIDQGHADSVKPIIPVCQAYDDYALEPAYILTPKDLAEFIQGVKGYKSVSFWSYQHILRDDCWDAIRDNKLVAPSREDLGIPDLAATQQVASSAQVSTPPATTTATPAVQASEVEQDNTNTPPETAQISDTHPISETPAGDITKPDGVKTGMATQVPLSATGPTTVVIKPSKKVPGAADIVVTHHKPHIDYVIEFFQWLFRRKGGKK